VACRTPFDEFIEELASLILVSDKDYLRLMKARGITVAYMGEDDPNARRISRAVDVALRRYERRQGDEGRRGTWIPTPAGHRFWLLDPRPSEVSPLDIAYGMGREGRYANMTVGHPFSDAQHVVLCSYLVPPEFALHALLHDGHETYIGDQTAPWKQSITSNLKDVEGPIKAAIATRFDIEWTAEAERVVKQADHIALATEMRDTTPWGIIPGRTKAPPCLTRLTPLPWQDSVLLFAARLNELYGEDLLALDEDGVLYEVGA
jgi:5'-deoxynucleotidase YfbR-like HD superfamily hydrolase